MKALLDGISGLTVKWTLVPLGQGRSLASHADYQAFLKASTKEKDSNLNLMVRVDVKAPDDPPKRRGPAAGHRPPRPPLAALDSLLNSIGTTTALPGFSSTRMCLYTGENFISPTASKICPLHTNTFIL